MKKALLLLVAGIAVVGVALTARTALAQRLVASIHYDFYDCDGGTTQNVADGRYVVSFKDEVVWECVGDAGCANGGQFFSPGVSMSQSFYTGGNTTPVSCRSSGLTGDMTMTLLGPGNP